MAGNMLAMNRSRTNRRGPETVEYISLDLESVRLHGGVSMNWASSKGFPSPCV